MELPVWHFVGIGSGLIIGIVSVLHVFVAQFAVGGGIYLVWMERRAYRDGAPEILQWLERHTHFFLLLTMVFGGLSGVGIWFTMRVVNPGATSMLIHNFAAAFLELFAEAGIRELPAPRKVMRISRPLELRDGEKYIRALPYAGFRVDCTIDFPHPTIGRERFSMEVTPENFTRVANARTFGFFKDVEYLHSHGLARGGSLESVVVLDDNGVMNPEGLRYKDEFVRHKVLDFIGDMAMLGMPIQGQFEICCSGHQLNNAFLRKAESERALQLIDLSLEEAQNRKTREKRPAYEGSLALA